MIALDQAPRGRAMRQVVIFLDRGVQHPYGFDSQPREAGKVIPEGRRRCRRERQKKMTPAVSSRLSRHGSNLLEEDSFRFSHEYCHINTEPFCYKLKIGTIWCFFL